MLNITTSRDVFLMLQFVQTKENGNLKLIISYEFSTRHLQGVQYDPRGMSVEMAKCVL